MDPSYNVINHRSLYVSLYAVFVGLTLALLAVVGEMVDSTPETRKHMVICFAALIMNVVSALWVFTASPTGKMKHNYWKAIAIAILLFTGFLSLYLAFSMLMPEWFTLERFILICIIVAIIGGYNVLLLMFSWCYQKFVVAVTYVTYKLMALILRTSRLPTDGDIV